MRDDRKKGTGDRDKLMNMYKAFIKDSPKQESKNPIHRQRDDFQGGEGFGHRKLGCQRKG